MIKSIARNLLSRVAEKNGYRLIPKHQPVRANIPKKLKAMEVKGWFWDYECYELYILTMMTEGPILEIGHFLGRSTACICEALKDSNKSREFNSYDLGFTTPEEFREFFDNIHKRETPIPSIYLDLVYSKNMTTTQIAQINMKSFGFNHLVKLISGNFITLDKNKYSFIFCDAVHEPNEISHNLPHLIERSNKNCIWVFHDMNETNIQCVLNQSNAVLLDRVQLLGIFLFKG